MLLGNHEILALGMRKFGGEFVPHEGITSRSFERSWALNGGQDRDQELLTDDDVAWLLDCPMVGLDADHLLLHSDTEEYLIWGDSIDEINANARTDLHSDEITVWWEMWRRMTSRYAFRGDTGPVVAAELLDRLGGRMDRARSQHRGGPARHRPGVPDRSPAVLRRPGPRHRRRDLRRRAVPGRQTPPDLIARTRNARRRGQVVER